MKLQINFSNSLKVTSILLLFILSLLTIHLTIDHSIFSKILTYIALSAIPDFISILFIASGLFRVIFFNLVAILLLRSSPRVKIFSLVALSLEVLAIVLNHIIIKVPINLPWLIISTFPTIIFLYHIFITPKEIKKLTNNFKKPQVKPLKKTGGSISFRVTTSITKLKKDLYNPYKPISKMPSVRRSLKNFMVVLFVLLMITLGFLLFKDLIIDEIKFFRSNATFMKDSGLDDVVKKIPQINEKIEKLSSNIVTNDILGNRQNINKKDNLAEIKKEAQRRKDLEKRFASKIHQKKYSKKNVTHYELAHAYLAKKNFSMAVKEFNLALKQPQTKYTKMLTHYFLAKIYERNYNNFNLALRHWMILKNMPSHNIKYQTNLPQMAVKEVSRLKNVIKNSRGRK